MTKRQNLRERIVQLIDDQDYEEVGRFGRRAVEVLRELIATDDSLRAAKAVHGASYLKPNVAVELVAAGARSRQRSVRVAAAVAAPRLKEAGIPILKRLLKSKDPSVQKCAARSESGEWKSE